MPYHFKETYTGAPGTSASITSATALALPSGSTPTVTMGGTAQERTFTFGIPRGADGDPGMLVFDHEDEIPDNLPDGAIVGLTTGAPAVTGPIGVTPNIQIGTVTKLAYIDDPYVTREPSSPDEFPVLNFGIPMGAPAAEGGSGSASVLVTIGKTSDCDFVVGVNDFHLKMEDAIRYVSVNSSSGGRIVLREGLYDQYAPININVSGVTIEGAGKKATQIIRRFASGDSFLLLASDVQIKGICFMGQRIIYQEYHAAINIQDYNNVDIFECDFEGWPVAINSTFAENPVSRNIVMNRFHDCAMGINLMSSGTISSNYFYQSSIAVYGDSVISNNRIDNYDRAGISANGVDESIKPTISNNYITNCRYGVDVESYIDIIFNRLYNNDIGINISGDGFAIINANIIQRGTGQPSALLIFVSLQILIMDSEEMPALLSPHRYLHPLCR